MAYHNMGRVLDDLGKTKEAVASYKKSIEINPEYVTAYNNMGVVLTKLGRNKEAVSIYKKTI